MQFADEPLPGVRRVILKKFEDARGNFVKTFSAALYAQHGENFELCEEFYSMSKKNVIRGMHFQLPPHDHAKIVYCAVGAVDDVLLDLRNGEGYGRTAVIRLSAELPQLLIIPTGIAHGFKSLSDNSLMIYKTTTEHSPEHDSGIRWDSFCFDWNLDNPTISDRDRRHPSLGEFTSPFQFRP